MKAGRECRIAALGGILLTFLSGGFSLARLDLGNLKVRYGLFALSLTFLLVSLGSGLSVISLSRPARRFLAIFYSFAAYAAFSLLWLDNIATGIPKFIDIVFMFALLATLSVVVHVFHDREELATVMAYFFVLIGFVYSWQILVTGLASGSYRGEVYEGGYNVQTRILFMALCSSLFLSARKGHWIYTGLFCLFLAAIVLLASKQGIIAAALMLLAYLLLKSSKHYRRTLSGGRRLVFGKSAAKRLLVMVALTLVAGSLFADKLVRIISVTQRVFGRFYVWDVLSNKDFQRLSGEGDRGYLFVNSVATIREHPWFGIGLAGYCDVPEIAFYPHNIALEFALDGGAPSVFFLLVFVGYGLYLLIQARKSIYLPFGLIPMYMVIVSLVSGGLYDFRYYFMWVVVLLYLVGRSSPHGDSASSDLSVAGVAVLEAS